MENWWKNYPWRMLQMNLREIDMRDISADRCIQDLLDFNATVLLINTAGIIASYETELPYHYQSRYLQGDSLNTIVDRCHENNIRVIARTDFSKVRREIYEQHPAWAVRTTEGKVIDYNGDVQTCPNSEYQRVHILEIIREAFEKIPFDGLYCNMGGFQPLDYSYRFYGICQCENCKKRFHEMFQMELPTQMDDQNPVYQKYKIFQERCLKENKNNVIDLLNSIRPGIAYDDEEYARIESSTEYKRRPPLWQYHASSNTRVIRGDGSKEMIPSNSSVDFIGYFYRHVSVTPELQELRLWQNLANLGGLDYYIIGRVDNRLDRSAFDSVKKVFSFHKAHESEFLNLKAIADVMLVRGQRWVHSEEEKGWIRALTENHILFDEIAAKDLDGNNIGKYKAIILPDIKYISEEHARKLDEYAMQGGRVIATGETAFYDDKYGMRSSIIPQCLGISKVNRVADDMVSSMLLVEDEEKEIFTSFKNTDVIAVDKYVYIEPRTGAEKLLKLIPPHSFGPPERCYFTEISEEPGLYQYNMGKGFGVYIPWLPGTFLSGEGYSNSFNFMKDILLSLCGLRSAAPELTPMIEVTAASGKDGRLVIQLVNNSGYYGVSYFKPLSVHDIKLEIASEREPKAVKSLKTEEACSFSYKNQVICINLNRLDEYDALVVRF